MHGCRLAYRSKRGRGGAALSTIAEWLSPIIVSVSLARLWERDHRWRLRCGCSGLKPIASDGMLLIGRFESLVEAVS